MTTYNQIIGCSGHTHMATLWFNFVLGLSNDPGKVDSNFFCYAATVLSPHRNVLIFTQRMHKPTRRPFTQ